MLTATPSSGPAAFVAINGMFSVAGTTPQLSATPTTMLTMPPNFGASSYVPNSGLNPTSFIFPSTPFPPSTNMGSPFSPPPFNSSLFPFLNSPGAGLLSGNASIPIPQLGPSMPPMLQPPLSNHSLGSFPPTMSVTSVAVGSFGSQSLLSDGTSMSIATGASNILSTFPPHPLIFPLSSLGGPNPNPTNNTSDLLALPMGPVSSTSASITNSISTTSTSGSTLGQSFVHPLNSSSDSVMPVSTITPASEPVHISPSLQTTFKIDKSRPVAPGANSTARANYSTSITSLESVDFHRDEILDAIDKLRERKARPDFERISCMLKRHRNINPDQTQLCLGRLAASGAVVCVDYKGNISYRNPSKWRKTSINLGTTNPPNVSQRLIDALHYLMSGANGMQNKENAAAPPILPGPNGGYSLFQIERALQACKSDTVPTSKSGPELTGATLRVCLDRESVNGKLAKTPDGRYVLDESGDRKKLANIAVNPSPSMFNKKPLPPNSSSLLLPNSMNQKYGKISPVACIAPAGDSLSRPLAAKQTPGTVSIAPLCGKPLSISPLLCSSSRLSIGRRGRPPGSKGRRLPSSQSQNCSSEKKLKYEPSSSSCTSSCSADSLVDSFGLPALVNHSTNGLNTLNSKFTTASPVISQPKSISNTSTALSLPVPLVHSAASTAVGTIMPAPIASLPFAGTQSIPPAFSSPFLSFSSCPPAIGSCTISAAPELTPLLIPSSSVPCSLPLLPGLDESPIITLLANLDSSGTEPVEVKSENGAENMCVHCGTQPTAEEPFLICKDCGTRAHPTCLDYWPELTERARQSAWQCAECKTCAVCQDTRSTLDLLVCDACDKGFHPGCHLPKLQEPVDRSLPWVCSDCKNEGYSVAIGTMPNEINDSCAYQNGNVSRADQSGTISHSEDDEIDVNVTEVEDETNQENPHVTEHSSQVPAVATKNDSLQSARSSTPCTPIQDCTNVGRPRNSQESCPVPTVKFTDEDSSLPLVDRPPDSVPCSSSLPDVKPSRTSDQAPSQTDDLAYQDQPVASGVPECFSHECCHRPNDVRAWSVDHVHDWLLSEGFQREAEAFHQQEIDGACLLLMKRMDVLTELGIKLGPAVKIYERIKRLQSTCLSASPLST